MKHLKQLAELIRTFVDNTPAPKTNVQLAMSYSQAQSLLIEIEQLQETKGGTETNL